jgi:6,7-dimethyl-8-ribityllumazine synthase
MKIAIVSAPYYQAVARELLLGAEEALNAADAEVTVFEVAGALEIPGAIARLADRGYFDGFIALGCVIRGETSHYDVVAGESARALMDLTVTRRLAIGNGILTTEDMDQALERARRHRLNKGRDAVCGCLSLINIAKA